MRLAAVEPRKTEVSVLTAPHWATAFLVFAAVLSLVPFFVGFLLGFSVASDVVFGVYALISGLAADLILRWKPGWVLVVWRRPRVPFIALWVVLCGYVILFRPFE